MKKIVCMLMIMLVMTLSTEIKAAEPERNQWLWDGEIIYNVDIITLEAPAVQCAVDGNCEEINDSCLDDNSCTKLKSCIVYSEALFRNGNWYPVSGGGMHCDDILFHGMASTQDQNEEPTEYNIDNSTNIEDNSVSLQNGATITVNKRNRR